MTYTQCPGSAVIAVVLPHTATGVDEISGMSITGAVAFLAAVFGLCLTFKIRAIRLERTVEGSSSALQKLDELNTLSRPYLATLAAMDHFFPVRVESLQKFQRFDLARFMSDNVLRYEDWFEREVGARLRALELFSGYEVSVQRLVDKHLGQSAHPEIDTDRFVRVEKKLFDKRILPRPVPSAHLIAEVSYTSPAGRNSYSRRLQWDFNALAQGLRSAQAVRARTSSAEALRARERSLMTNALRMDILRRDAFRCQMCGASRDDGATLHVDHIMPVSRGGRTVVENLQTLCQACNLGKSNRFVG